MMAACLIDMCVSCTLCQKTTALTTFIFEIYDARGHIHITSCKPDINQCRDH